MVDIIQFLKDWSWLLEILIAIIVFIAGIFSENKYNLINKVKRWLAIRKNEGADINMTLQYESETDFSNLKKSFKDKFRTYSLEVIKESKIRMDFSFDIFLITLIENQEKKIFVEIKRMGCGIKDLHRKIEEFMNKMVDFEKNKIFKKFISCDIIVKLPYRWSYININKPKGFKVKDYSITIQKTEGFQSEVEIKLDSINMSLNTKEEIIPLLQKLL